jgi:hypothetical protein
VHLTVQGFPPDTYWNHSETARELQTWNCNHMNIPDGQNGYLQSTELIENRKSSRREEARIAQGKRSAPLGKQFNSNAQLRRSGTNLDQACIDVHAMP